MIYEKVVDKEDDAEKDSGKNVDDNEQKDSIADVVMEKRIRRVILYDDISNFLVDVPGIQ